MILNTTHDSIYIWRFFQLEFKGVSDSDVCPNTGVKAS